MRKVKVTIYMDFEADEKQPFEKIVECINSQIFSDMNVYWQNEDETAQMTGIKIKCSSNKVKGE